MSSFKTGLRSWDLKGQELLFYRLYIISLKRKKGFIMTASFVKLFGVDAAGSDTVAVHLLTSSAVFCMSVNTISKTH